MKPVNYPKSKEADICLILEGTYPFAGGGVSNWVYELIKVFPEYTFAIIFLGTREQDYSGFSYPLLDNVVHLEAHFLFELNQTLEHSAKKIDGHILEKIKIMHDKFVAFEKDSNETIPEIHELTQNDGKITEQMFLRSKSTWQFIETRYHEKYSDQSFFDYFWGVRNLHRPIWDLIKIVDQIPKVKILHSASTGYAGFLGALLQKKYGIPYILTEHGIYTKERWIEFMRNYFFNYISQEHKKFEIERGLLNIWMNFFKILGKVGYQAADTIISLTEEYRERQIMDGAERDKTKIISYGIDFDRYKFLNKQGFNKDKLIIACIGRVVPIKDIKSFIRASAIIFQKHPSAEAWIIGSLTEDPEYVTTCKSLAEVLGITDKIKFLGTIKNIMEIYPKIDLVLLSSISEGSPFVILESFAVGIPVVATDVGGCGELIYGKNDEDRALGSAGKLVPMADPEALANAALELGTNETLWRKSQEIALTRIRKYYAMQELKKNYNLIYKKAIVTWQE